MLENDNPNIVLKPVPQPVEFWVFYLKPDFRRDRGFEMPTRADVLDIMGQGKFAMVKIIKANGLEDVWEKMQGENWSPNGEARPVIMAKGLDHTSMDVGDVVLDTRTLEMFVCRPVGFQKLEK